MAKSKYESNVKPNLDRVLEWASDGASDIQIAGNLKISMSTFYEHLNKYTEFSDTLKKGRDIVDNKVENALLKRALGYEATEEFLEIKTVNGVENKVLRKNKKHIPADVGASIFWLKNRKSNKWRDKPDEVINENIEIKISGV